MPAKIAFTAEQIDRMRDMYARAASFSDIAIDLGCSKNTVRKYLLAAGVVPDRSRSIAAKQMGNATRLGAKWSDESRQRMAERLQSDPRGATRTGPHSAETKRRISEALLARPPRMCPDMAARNRAAREACKRFLRRVFKATGVRKAIPSEQYLGYSRAELAAHLGDRPDGAHLDHYVPVAEFLRRGLVVPGVINAMPNLRWLDGEANRRKADSVPHDADVVIERCIRDADLRGVLTAQFNGGRAVYSQGLA